MGLGVRIGSLPSGQTSLFVGLWVASIGLRLGGVITGLAVKIEGLLDGKLVDEGAVGAPLGLLVVATEGGNGVGTAVTVSGAAVGLFVAAKAGDVVGASVSLVTGGLVGGAVDEKVGSGVIGACDSVVVGDGDPGIVVVKDTGLPVGFA